MMAITCVCACEKEREGGRKGGGGRLGGVGGRLPCYRVRFRVQGSGLRFGRDEGLGFRV
jgi:hypothetical protein